MIFLARTWAGSRGLGWTSNTGNYFGADGSQGTVLNINTTAGKRYKLSLYMVSGIQPGSQPDGGGAVAQDSPPAPAPPPCPTSGMVSSPCSATKQAGASFLPLSVNRGRQAEQSTTRLR